MKLIGITGLARAGKDSFYNFSKPILESIKETHNRYAFADALKEGSEELLSMLSSSSDSSLSASANAYLLCVSLIDSRIGFEKL